MIETPRVVFYVSGHGFGHGARSSHVLRELRRMAPLMEIEVRTATPAWLYPDDIQHTPLEADIGMLQHDSLAMLVDETIQHAAAYERRRPDLVAAEAAALAAHRPSVVVGDIPPLAFDVAAALGVPGLAIGNFSWDWIYANLGSTAPEVDEVVSAIAASERRATLLLRLPFHDAMSAFPHVEDVPLIACVSAADRRETRRRLGITDGRPLVLVSYGGFTFDRLKPEHLAAVPDVCFVTTTMPPGLATDNVIVVPKQATGYQDLLAACDAVMMKPGYGTVADCIANRVPMIYTPRGGFAEESVLVGAMERVGRAVHLPQEALFSGAIRPAIEAALGTSAAWEPMRLDGAAVIARRVLEHAGLRCDPDCDRSATGP